MATGPSHAGAPDAPRPLSAPIPEPFPLVRHFITGSVLVILVALLIVNMISASVERRSVQARLEQEALEAARVVAFSLAERLTVITGSTSPRDFNFLLYREQMDRLVLDLVRGQPVVRVDVLIPDGTIAYSTDPSVAASDAALTESPAALSRAINQGGSSRYLADRELQLLGGQTGKYDLVETVIPLTQEGAAGTGDSAPYAVVVMYRDVTAGVESATSEGARFRLITVAATMVAMFLALLWVVARGQGFSQAVRSRLADMLERERDLSAELDRRNADLTAANETKNNFLSAVSHELKTPLTGLIAFTDLLLRNRDHNLTPRQLEQLQAMKRNGAQLRILIDDLLDLSRIESGKLRFDAELFDLKQLIDETVAGMTPIFAEKKQTLSLVTCGSEMTAFADRARIQQVLTNLLSNASKYSPQGSNVQLQSDQKDGMANIAVVDQGIGISKEDQKQLFTEFFRANNEATRSVPGTGLGLVIVKSIVELHGGQIWVESEPGVGTTIRFTLPLTTAAEEHAAA